MLLLSTLFMTTYVFVALRAFQNLNIFHHRYALIIPTSYFMAAAEIWIITVVAKQGWELHAVIAMGSGGWLGAISSMYLHKKLVNKK